MKSSTFLRGMIAGMLGGVAGTFVMYLFGGAIFLLLGWATNTSITIIGNSAAAFFAKFGIEMAGGAALGVRLYYLIGLAMGAVFGAAAVRLKLMRGASLGKMVWLGILYVEVLSLPLLAAGIYGLNMEFASAALWLAISAVMHMVYGIVLGLVTHLGVRGAAREGTN